MLGAGLATQLPGTGWKGVGGGEGDDPLGSDAWFRLVLDLPHSTLPLSRPLEAAATTDGDAGARLDGLTGRRWAPHLVVLV